MRLPFVGNPGKEEGASQPERSDSGTIRRVSVLEGHALWASTYDNDPNPLLALEERELEPLLPALKSKYVLDVGCGTGRWLARLLRRGAHQCVGIDLSGEMLRRAKRKPSLRGRLLRADCLSLPVRDSVADLIVCSFAAGYVDNLRRLAGELARVSRPRGQVFITDFHPSGHLRGWKRAFRHGEELVEISSFAHSLEQIERDFVAEGFDLRTCLAPCLTESEKWIFEEKQKSHLYEIAREVPAIFICHFELDSSSPTEMMPS